MQELKVFDQLVADISLFVAPTKSLRVTNPESSQSAIETAQNIKLFISLVETKRKEMVGPLNQQVKAINDYCKQITAPLNDADMHVRSELNAFAAEQEKIRRAERDRIERERIEAERKANEERERLEEELRIRQEQEAEDHAEAASLFGHENGDIEKTNEELNKKQEREWAEKQAEIERESVIRAMTYQQAQFDANQNQIKNTRSVLKARVIDLALIPKEFLIIEPNLRALEAVGKTGAKIPGVEFYEEVSVAIGRTTRLPSVKRG